MTVSNKNGDLMNRFRLVLALNFILLISITHANTNSNGQKGVVRTLSAKTLGKSTMNIGAGVSFGQSSSYLQGPLVNGVVNGNPIGPDNEPITLLDPARLFSSNGFLGFGILRYWDLTMSLPFYYDWSGIKNLRDGGLGDLEVSTKFQIPLPGKVAFQAYHFALTAPVGMDNGLFPRHPYLIEERDTNPADNFYSSSYPTFKGLMLWSFDVGGANPKVPLTFHLNIGAVIPISDNHQNNTAIGGLAVEYQPAEFITIFTDFNGESRWSNFSTGFDFLNDPIYVSPGFRITAPSGLYLYLAGDFSISSRKESSRLNWASPSDKAQGYKYSTGTIPDKGVQFLIGWNGFLTIQDDDKDGIKNDEDRCPKDPEDIDNFEDSDGCPELDNDNDGVADLADKCPLESEDKDGFKDEDGCPDLDNDADGIADLKDQCPNMAEDFDGFEDTDGCIDADNDKDGVQDAQDRCPNDAEDFDKYQDDDGCPDIDNDKDAIPDLRDRCPDEPETFNNFEDKDGCPDTVRKEPEFPKQQILRGVTFRTNTAEMSFDSYQFLDPIVKAMKQYPEIEIEIRGHTDSMGNFSKNMEISQMRAEAVRQYLISKDIASSRIRAVGFGSTSPIADNKNAAGRSQNRRIEVIRVK